MTSSDAQLSSWIDNTIFPVDPNNPDPGRVTLRRLNRNEYRNTIRDLLGVTIDVDEILPPDDSGYGFDNIGDTLSLSPTHLERYFDAAETALDLALVIGPMPRERQSATGGQLRGDGQPRDTGRYLITNGEVAAHSRHPVPDVIASKSPPAAHPVAMPIRDMELRVGGHPLHAVESRGQGYAPKVHAHEWNVENAGGLDVSAAFTNDFYDENHPDPARRDRNLWIVRIDLWARSTVRRHRNPKPTVGSLEKGRSSPEETAFRLRHPRHCGIRQSRLPPSGRQTMKSAAC